MKDSSATILSPFNKFDYITHIFCLLLPFTESDDILYGGEPHGPIATASLMHKGAQSPRVTPFDMAARRLGTPGLLAISCAKTKCPDPDQASAFYFQEIQKKIFYVTVAPVDAY